MKKILSLVLALAFLATLCLTLASCGKKLSGTYVNNGFMGDITYEFNGNKVTITVGTILGDVPYSGKYKITKDKEKGMQITFTFEDSNASEYNKTYTFEETEDGIKLNGLLYKKQ